MTHEEGRHGPYFSLTRAAGGKTRSRWLSAEEADVVRRQLEEGDLFRGDVDAYWEACESLADLELEPDKQASPEEAEKGGSSR
jgi:hypothetical protein